MPAILAPEAWPAWLGEEPAEVPQLKALLGPYPSDEMIAWPVWLGEQPADVPDLKALLAPYPSDDMIAWPVSARVGNVRNNDSSLIEPVAAA